MREIKFRGKSNDDERWIYGYVIKNQIGNTFIGHMMELQRVYEETVEQFTGLYDCNGREIYEGDIIHKQSCWNLRVKFDDGAFYLEGANEVQYINKTIHSIASRANCEGFEVIGNIHDNPELSFNVEGEANEQSK